MTVPTRSYELPPTALTNRELEVSGLLADGLTTTAIARTLRIAESTVRLYISRVCEKAGQPDRYAVVAWVRARRAG